MAFTSLRIKSAVAMGAAVEADVLSSGEGLVDGCPPTRLREGLGGLGRDGDSFEGAGVVAIDTRCGRGSDGEVC